MLLRDWRLATILLVSLSFGASFTHVLELPAKVTLGGGEYLLVQSIYRYFGPVASVLEPLSIIALIGLVVMTRHRPSFGWTVAALAAFVVSTISWLVLVSPMNADIARWTEGIPASWTATRDRWEWGHVAVFVVKLVALVALVESALLEIPPEKTR